MPERSDLNFSNDSQLKPNSISTETSLPRSDQSDRSLDAAGTATNGFNPGKLNNSSKPVPPPPTAYPSEAISPQAESPNSLRRELVTNILPWIVAPSGAAALLAYGITAYQDSKQAEQELQNQVIAVSQSTRDRLNAAQKVPRLVAPDPAVVEFSQRMNQNSQRLGSAQASNNQVDQNKRNDLQAQRLELNGDLKQIAQAAGFMELSITDKNGVYIAANHSTPKLAQRDENWWKLTKQNGQVTALVTDETGTVAGIDVTQAIVEPNTGTFLGNVRGRFTVNEINQALSVIPLTQLANSQQVQILALEDNQIKPVGTLTTEGFTRSSDVLGGAAVVRQITTLLTDPPSPKEILDPQSPVKWVNYREDGNTSVENRGLLSTFSQGSKIYTLATIPGSNWVAVSSMDSLDVGGNSNWAWAIASIVFTLAAIAAYGVTRVARRWAKTLTELSHACEKAASGNLNVQLAPGRSGELQRLTQSFNELVVSVRTQVQRQDEVVKQSQFYTELAQAASRGDTQTVFELTVQLAKQQMEVDRVVIYSFKPDWSGKIVAEAVEPQFARALNDKITDSCIPRDTLEEYRKGRYVPTTDVFATHYSADHLQLLERLQVKANLVVPVVSGERLLGLLVAHQCSSTRVWNQAEISFLRELAVQVGLSLTGTMLASEKADEAERARQLNKITFRIREILEPEQIYTTTVEETRESLKCDRLVVYLFDKNWQGKVVAESVDTPGLQRSVLK